MQDLKIHGFELEVREEIKDQRGDKVRHLDENIAMQRKEWGARMPGMVEDLNEVLKSDKNAKIYI